MCAQSKIYGQNDKKQKLYHQTFMATFTGALSNEVEELLLSCNRVYAQTQKMTFFSRLTTRSGKFLTSGESFLRLQEHPPLVSGE